MNDEAAAEEFSRMIGAVIARFLAQNGRGGITGAEGVAVGGRLWALVVERGLPRAWPAGECGAPGGMSEEEWAPLVARVLGGVGDDALAKAVQQLVKACFYPELTVCRDSFRELTKGGGCRRQELDRVRGRVSGTHCVDCPHWVGLTPEAHEKFLTSAWRAEGAGEWAGNRGVFLPEDFRTLRRWIQARTRPSR